MQRDREARENFNTSGGPFHSFGFPGSLFPSMFGGKDPFDDPFFTRPFGPGNSQQSSRLKGPVIEELDIDADEVPEIKEEDDMTDAAWANRNPLVEHPEDQASDHGKGDSNRRESSYRVNHNKAEVTQPQSRSVSFQRVTYGGINGAYYTATASRRTGNDGVTLEESKQADRTTGQATHRISRGIHDKGHSVTRKLDSDGTVGTVQTLHNLDEDELAGFEQAWKGSAQGQLRGWNDTIDFPRNSGNIGTRHGLLSAWGGFRDPFREHSDINNNFQSQSSTGRPKKVVTINIE